MVQKKKGPPEAPEKADEPVPPKRRGRPRAYEPEVALGKALDLFRATGFAATSLDDLSAATGRASMARSATSASSTSRAISAIATTPVR